MYYNLQTLEKRKKTCCNRTHLISHCSIYGKSKPINMLNVSTPDSSQTDSDDVSPQIHRKRKNTHQRDVLPRFSISIEDEHSG